MTLFRPRALSTFASDTFTRADSASSLGTADQGGAWTVTAGDGTWGITSNKGYAATPKSNDHSIATLSVAQNNVTVSCDITLSSTSNRATAGLRLRAADVSNWLGSYLYKTGTYNMLDLQQVVSGAQTSLASVTSLGLVNGNTYNLKVVISGTTAAVYLDGVLKIAATSFNSGLTTQKYGINLFSLSTDFDDGGTRFDNFLVTL